VKSHIYRRASMASAIPRWTRLLVFVTAMLFSGCGGSDAGVGQTSAGIGPSGGTYSPGGGISLQVPPGALAQTVQIAAVATQTDASAVSGYTAVSKVYQFGPDGTVFAGSGATLTLPLPPNTPAGVTILSTKLGDLSSFEDLHATVSGGSISATVHHFSNFHVAVAVIAPSNLAYSTNPAVYTVGTAIPANVPSSNGGAVTSYSVVPALPAGLTLDTTTGRITGTPTATSATASYVVTAGNSAGSTTASLAITVNSAVVAPSNLAYSTNPAVYTVGTTE
jgi:hypothetical protein